MGFKIGSLNHLTFAVENIDRSIEFYKTVLQGKLLARGENLAYFDIAGLWIALNKESKSGNRERQHSYTHVAFSMSEGDQKDFVKHLQNNGIKFTHGRARDKAEGQSVYVRDYDNHLFEFHSKTREDRLDFYHHNRPGITIL